MKIFLDDERKIPNGWLGVKTPEQCISWLEKCAKENVVVKKLSLDHDLGLIDPNTLQERTGYDVLVWLENNLWAMPEEVIIHTANPVARRRMNLVLEAIERGNKM